VLLGGAEGAGELYVTDFTEGDGDGPGLEGLNFGLFSPNIRPDFD